MIQSYFQPHTRILSNEPSDIFWFESHKNRSKNLAWKKRNPATSHFFLGQTVHLHFNKTKSFITVQKLSVVSKNKSQLLRLPPSQNQKSITPSPRKIFNPSRERKKKQWSARATATRRGSALVFFPFPRPGLQRKLYARVADRHVPLDKSVGGCSCTTNPSLPLSPLFFT